METKQLSTTLLIGIALITVGVLAFVSCFTVLFSYKKTDACVTSCERHEDYDSEGNTTVEYYINADYTVDGETFSAFTKMSKYHSVGEMLPLYYHKFNPAVYKFEHLINMRIITGFIFAAVGTAITIAHLFTGFEIEFTSED